jgi:hypothetical protein
VSLEAGRIASRILTRAKRGCCMNICTQRPDYLALRDQGHGDDRTQVLQDDGLLALEPVVQAGVGRDERATGAHDLLDDGPGAEEAQNPLARSRLPIRIQTSDDRFGHPLGLVGTSNWDGNDSCLFSRIVVTPHEQGITDEEHLFQ